ncbi:hypothetical protein K7X08_010119 [Anisodus acutangulus]|uniref:Uncharacterized protein n=1 Tax=Anisodus acutangulus TaxID=402998 RepID=A0A9Q1RVF5_9SOLA|nr:hypothetical protein K7X08_010119 [Anisodus acutangulus]
MCCYIAQKQRREIEVGRDQLRMLIGNMFHLAHLWKRIILPFFSALTRETNFRFIELTTSNYAEVSYLFEKYKNQTPFALMFQTLKVLET